MKKLLPVLLLFIGAKISAQTAPPPADTTHQHAQHNDTAQVSGHTEQMPEFPGGWSAFSQYLYDSLRYPQIEREAGKEGVVYVQFIVETDGSITEVKVVKAVPGAPGFSKEAIRVISKMPRWTPGTMDGKPVRVLLTQPIRFVNDPLQQKKKRKHRR